MKIHELTLYTSKLAEIESFYSERLGVKLIDRRPNFLRFKIGDTSLNFERTEKTTYYHFAINIPSHQIEDARKWIQNKTELLPFLGNEIVDFESWNAEALYFYDPAGNIVELIARKNLEIPSVTPFNASSFQHISEIGLPVTDVRSTFDQLKEQCGLSKFSGDYERFCAIGWETGLFITVDFRKKDWIPNNDEAHPFPFSCVIENKKKIYSISYFNQKLTISPASE